MTALAASVLLSSAGRRGQLVECFRASARELGCRIRILAADQRPELSAACRLVDEAHSVPSCRDTQFISRMLEVCGHAGVRVLVPTIDTELTSYSLNIAAFMAVGTSVVVSEPEVVATARDKLRTTEVFGAGGISTPRTLKIEDWSNRGAELNWPVIVKPRGGSSSVGIKIPADRADMDRLVTLGGDAIVQELRRGREFTVNLYVDRRGVLRCAVPHERLETRGGEVSKGRTVDLPVLRDLARKVVAALPGARGPLCFQAIVDSEGRASVFEINARFGGGYPLAHHAGAPFTQWILEEALGLPLSAHDNWRPGVTMLRYDQAVFC